MKRYVAFRWTGFLRTRRYKVLCGNIVLRQFHGSALLVHQTLCLPIQTVAGCCRPSLSWGVAVSESADQVQLTKRHGELCYPDVSTNQYVAKS